MPPAVEAAGAPGQSLVSRLAGSTPGALGSSAAAAEKLLKRKADLISSPSLPAHLQPALQGKTSSSEARCCRIIAVAPAIREICSSLASWCLCIHHPYVADVKRVHMAHMHGETEEQREGRSEISLLQQVRG